MAWADRRRVLELCSDVSEVEPDWDAVFNSIAQERVFNRKNVWDSGTLVGLIAEHHFKNCLKKKCENGDIGFHVVLGKPVRQPYKCNRFSYDVNGNGSVRLYDHSIHNGILYCQFDYSANIQGIPAFFEVNVGRYANKGGRRGNHRGVRKNIGLKKQLSEEQRKRLFKPLFMSFGQDFTYALIVARDTMDKISNSQSNLSRLRVNGGVVIPIYATREQFREDVLRECERRGIGFKVG